MNENHIDLCPCFDCAKDFVLRVGDVLVPLSTFRNFKHGNIRIIALTRQGKSGEKRVAFKYSTPTREMCTLEEALAGDITVAKAPVIPEPEKAHFNGWTEADILINYRRI